VDCLRNQFLAGTRFAQQQHGCPTGRHLINSTVNLAHRAAVADDILGAIAIFKLVAKPKVFRLKTLPL